MEQFFDGFDGAISEEWQPRTAGLPYSMTLGSPKTKKDSLRFQLNADDPQCFGSSRSEMSRHANKAQGANPGEVHYGFDMFLPAEGAEIFEPDVDEKGVACGSEILAQWHNVPDVEGEKTEEWTFPPLYLKTIGKDWEIGTLFDTSRFSVQTEIKESKKFKTYNLGSFLEDRGKWLRFCFQIKWGWLPEHEAFINITKNGKPFFYQAGPNTTNDEFENHFKLGIYKWDYAQPNHGTSKQLSRVVYYDNAWMTRLDPKPAL